MAKDVSDKDELFTAEWFPYYFERFEGSDRVAAMSLAEEGAYHRAIRLAWKFGTVPSDPKILAAKLQKRCTEKIASVVLSTFEPVPSDPKRMFHPVVEEIRATQKARAKRSHERAVTAAHARWGPGEGGDADATSMLQACPSNAQPMQDIDSDLRSQSRDEFKRLMDACVRVHAKVDARLVEIGMLYTLLQRNGSEAPIRSPRYFDPEIKRVVATCKGMGGKAIDALLVRRRQQVFGE